MEKSKYIQDFMEGNICFGCGKDNADGLHIKSYWEGNHCLCEWHSQDKYQGWVNLLNGGIMSTLVDCHCMGTALSHAYRSENRDYDSSPVYKYATGTINIRYIKPTPNDQPILLKSKILEVKDRKTIVHCEVWIGDVKTAEAEVIAIRVFDSSKENNHEAFSK